MTRTLIGTMLLTLMLSGQATGAETTITVKKGDTLYSLARAHRTSVKRIAELNALTEPYAIKIGQKLKMPADDAQSTAANDDTGKPQEGIKTNPFRTVAVVPMPPPPPAPTPVTSGNVAPNPTAQPASAEKTPTVAEPKPMAATAPSTAPAVATAKPAASDGKPTASAAATVPASSSTTPSTTTSAPVPSAVSTVPLPSAGSSGLQWQWPTEGTVIARFVPGDQTQQGINIAGRAGTPVNAAADGVVVYSGAGLVGYGELIIVKHSEEWLSAYAHNRARLVKEGQKVKAGETIAEMGRTGAVRDMLHFEIRRNGKPVDPEKHLPKR